VYVSIEVDLYTDGMDVAITDLRAHLSDWLARAREGEDLVVTDRGLPVARITGIDATPRIQRLIEQGVIARPKHPRQPIDPNERVPTPRRPLSDIISEMRD
jgi:prevent-host-death family protein